VSGARADVFHLKSGGCVEGAVISKDKDRYTVRTLVGTVTIPADAIERIEEQPTILDEYLRRAKDTPDAAKAHVDLANWCEENGLKAAQRKHLKQAIELDPDCEPARVALGYVRVGEMWVDGRTAADQRAQGADEKKAEAADTGPSDEEMKVVAAIQAQWTTQIRAIRRHKLESSVERLAEEGRKKIVEIRDPLAILPLTRLLSDGSWACRDALVEVLSHFPQDEATMNLSVLALADSDADIRRRALIELLRRNDPRVVPQFRRALYTDSDALVRRAAIGLGNLQAAAAVPDLINVLTTRRVVSVEGRAHHAVDAYFRNYIDVYNTPTLIALGRSTEIRYRPTLALPAVGMNYVFPPMVQVDRDVTVFRSEVREALVAITGADFGFDAAAWRRWYEEQQP
jgi:hypothetical protein